MRILIIEDEVPAAKRLSQLVQKELPKGEILEVLDSVESGIAWLKRFEHPDILFLDIQLADGMSFEILEAIGSIKSSIIFTTAFDHFAVKAFRANGLDYLLKPINPAELKEAIEKHKQKTEKEGPDLSQLAALLQPKSDFKERILVKIGDRLLHLSVRDIGYFYSEDGVTFTKTQAGKKHLIDYTIEELSHQLDPKRWFRINRGMIICIDSLVESHSYFNSRLKLSLSPSFDKEAIVSRDRVSDFKAWLEG